VRAVKDLIKRFSDVTPKAELESVASLYRGKSENFKQAVQMLKEHGMVSTMCGLDMKVQINFNLAAGRSIRANFSMKDTIDFASAVESYFVPTNADLIKFGIVDAQRHDWQHSNEELEKIRLMHTNRPAKIIHQSIQSLNERSVCFSERTQPFDKQPICVTNATDQKDSMGNMMFETVCKRTHGVEVNSFKAEGSK
jgi:hypothetical protein